MFILLREKHLTMNHFTQSDPTESRPYLMRLILQEAETSILFLVIRAAVYDNLN